ncbi:MULTISPECIES: hypothetical protein [unclassified Nocardioides]|uniref:hypothetical protein n=1 Tax=unclassified Nocardioides TaxID=2615069 RepID=UPI0009F14BDF|nr:MULTISPECIES: hypothetical protein [unclassified Nocardioides]GAW51326.1 Putative uncharacterized protein [Nocardioides sp. PD653-B2]GAW52673.1 putative uncharacterized protein [Nocardioides sp. PD653]
MSRGEVSGWPTDIWRPQLTMRVGAPPGTTLQVLLECLDAAGYRVTERDEHGFRARRVAWLDRIMLEGGTTDLEVRATGADVLVRVAKGAGERGGRTRAADGLSAAVEELRRRGSPVRTTAWGPPPP